MQTDFALHSLSQPEQAEYWACLALRHSNGLGIRSINKLLKYFGSALEAFQRPKDWELAKVPSKMTVSIQTQAWRRSALEEWKQAQKLRGGILLWTNPNYPDLLKQLPDAPLFLYYRGNINLIQGPCLAIVGTRKNSYEGQRGATYFAQALGQSGVTIVSGLAKGIDQYAHQAALLQSGRTIAVLGTGIDKFYPQEVEELYYSIGEQGLLLSEFSPGTTPQPKNFPIRNRIISGLSLGTLVIEAAMPSGSLITARIALEQNRAVFAVPGALGAEASKGCQELIRQGACPVFNVQDILQDLFPQLKHLVCDEPGDPVINQEFQNSATAPVHAQNSASANSYSRVKVEKTAPPPPAKPIDFSNLPGEQQKLAQILQNCSAPLSLEGIAEQSDFSAGELSAILIQMEVNNLIIRHPGQYYSLCE